MTTNNNATLTEDNTINSEPAQTPVENTSTQETIVPPQVVETTSAQEATIPASINLDVPFHVQAPDNKRVLPRTETCEEASLTLAAYYIKGAALSKELFKQESLALIELEKKMFNTYIDTSIPQLEALYQAYFNDGTTKIIENPTIQQIKEELAQGHIIVAPFAGRELNNPHFSGNGPRYHMLVIKGYDSTSFYTNDVGTIHGENYTYPYDVIINAMHDLTDGDISQ